MANNVDQLKQQVALAAVKYIQPYLKPDAIIGVGTGSTADLFIDALSQHKQQFKAAVASSKRSAERLRQHGITVLDLNQVETMPVYVDGADEINPQLQMIKGGGGALTQEKIVASVAEHFVCIADHSKWVETLGAFKIPLEVIDSAKQAVIRQLQHLGASQVTERAGFISDNGHPILDAAGFALTDARELEQAINQIPGVVCCGLFAQKPASVLLLAKPDGVQTISL
ncbi:ribose-5-phosphate isomerase RpiA [Brackiella oedipodis]|uniref:ribose-5-phosphate isomerase RpiA n=1 Tax=Brackiella oedipodis TaxID=124225 RepID=UPI00048D5B4E|nr:ribose-5-phosphate isomerase RpiA [Brackiella oedipodis]